MDERAKFGSIHGRFQIFHNDHLHYFNLAKQECDHLIVGITSVHLEALSLNEGGHHRSLASANPLTFQERKEMIKDCLLCEGYNAQDFSIIPFPIEIPEGLPAELDLDIPIYMVIREEWNKQKITLLKEIGYQIEVLFEDYDKLITGSMIRSMILEKDESWRSMVPVSVASYLDDVDIFNKLSHLANL